ncbi:MAG: leucine-rich repeat domain-containing protein [Eubacterium sp.]|nr:leucine-rich repeat domain-containing protein [Eubacterium sp.]
MNTIAKRIMAISLCVVAIAMLIALISSAEVYAEELDSGQAGDCQWAYYYNKSGKYVIHINGMSEGDGRIPDYTMVSGESTAPWTKYRNQVDEVSFSNVKEIGNYAFRDFTKISHVYIEGVRRIGDHAFYACSGLRYIQVHGDNCIIQDDAFNECWSNDHVMDLVELEGVKSLGYEAFGEVDCKELDLGEGLESIGNGCFYCNEALTNVFIPKSCTFIDERAFIGCDKLTDVCVANPSCMIKEYAFDKDYVKAIFGFAGSTAETYAHQKGIQFVPIGNLGTGTFDLSDGNASIQYRDPASPDFPVFSSIQALLMDGQIIEWGDAGLGYLDLDKDGNADISYDMDDKNMLWFSVLSERSVGGAISFTLSDEAIKNIETNVTPFYETLIFELPKLDNPMTVSPKTATVKYSRLKKKAQTLKVSKVLTIKNAKGTKSFKKLKGNKKITINRTSGKVTVKKGLKKGSYKVKVKVQASGDDMYKASAWKEAVFTIKVK